MNDAAAARAVTIRRSLLEPEDPKEDSHLQMRIDHELSPPLLPPHRSR